MSEREEIEVSVRVVLANGVERRYEWTTPVHFGRALGKGASWARLEMTAEKLKGRASIVVMAVTVHRTGRAYKRR